MTNTSSTHPPVLIVDLDGTLTPSNSLVELTLELARRDLMALFSVFWVLVVSGRLAFKRAISDRVEAQVNHWPWHPEVLSQITRAKARSEPVVLMTASDQRVATKVADHLGVFDAVYGSTACCNLKGAEKVRLIEAHYADASVTYIGDSKADIPVWQKADVAIGVGIDPSRLTSLSSKSAMLAPTRGNSSLVWPFLRALRPHQWLKNVLLFVPLVLAQVLTPSSYVTVFFGFVAFSLVASAVYVLNDLMDLPDDRAHPRKRARPLASGVLPIEWGVGGAAVLFGLGLGLALVLDDTFGLMLVGYLLFTTLYSFKLKRVAWIDVVTLSGLYTWRLISGAALGGVIVSPWLLVFSLSLFLSLAGMKRITELLDRIERGSESSYGRDYAIEDWRRMAWLVGVSLVCALTTFFAYLQAPTTALLYPEIAFIWGILPVLALWLTWMFWATLTGRMHDDPIVFAAMDPVSWLSGVVTAVLLLTASGVL